MVRGIVLGVEGSSVGGARVQLQREGRQTPEQKITADDGKFSFEVDKNARYSLCADKLGRQSECVTLPSATAHMGAMVELVLGQKGPQPETSSDLRQSPIGAIQFADQPNFTVAGVTDFTAVGGHGSDSTLRTSEALAIQTASLEPEGTERNAGAGGNDGVGSNQSEDKLKAVLARAPDSFDANHRLGDFYFQRRRYSEAIPLLQSAYRLGKVNRNSKDRQNEYELASACKAIGDPAHSRKYVQELIAVQESGDLYRLAGELDESLGDSLTAVREYQKAASLDPSEPNFFAWGSELLLHRAIWQAQQVFEAGTKHYPTSSRMLTGLGTALFSGAAYGEAARRLCEASDLNPSGGEPYIFLGKVQMASPDRLECVEPRLKRFVEQQPRSAVANYYYAMVLQKGQNRALDTQAGQTSEALLRNAIALDPKYAEAYLQLGILYASRRELIEAIAQYKRAIEADPGLSDAYYRLAVAYERSGSAAQAKEEFKLHDEVANQQAAEAERQRQEVKQFLVVLPPQAPGTQTP